MRTPTGAPSVGSLLRLTLLYAGLAAGTGCATLRATFAGWATGPDGITRPQQQLREALAAQDFPKALAWREDDALLRALTTGVAAYYAKQFARSGAVLDTAALVADDRITASISRNGLALVTNDMARQYQPRRTERLFIPYYAMLSYVQLGAWEDAAVEARRLVALLAQYGEDREFGERAVHGAMQHLAGAVFERAGERDDARVAYGAAHALLAALPERLPPGTIADEGEVLVVVERGFVAHRATETIELFIGGDRDSLRLDGDGHRRALARIAERAAAEQGEPRRAGSVVRGISLRLGDYAESPSGHDDDDVDDGDYYLSIALPSLRRSARPWGGEVRLAVDGAGVDGITATSVVDDAGAVDARRERTSLAVRAVARAAAKYAVVKAVKDKKGQVAGTLANIGGALLERADVRSWHLLPQEITLVRARVPAGRRAVRLQVGEGWAVRAVDVGSVEVRRGELTIVPVRLWRDPPPESSVEPAGRLAAAADSVCTTVWCP